MKNKVIGIEYRKFGIEYREYGMEIREGGRRNGIGVYKLQYKYRFYLFKK